MRKLTPIGIFCIVIMSLISGCSSGPKEVIEVSHTLLPKERVVQDVYIPKEVSLGIYEQEKGMYVGAYVESNQDVEGRMADYEALIGKEQAFRVFQYQKRGDMSSQEILECIAAKQIPYIKILANEAYDLMPIYEMIGDLNTRYQTPLFVELFPIQDDTLDPTAYAKYYDDAYKLLKKYFKDVVVVWSIDWNQVYLTPVYYPGNHKVDWVGLNASWPKYKEGAVYEPRYEEAMDFWYKYFQDEKPMMLSTVAISHFSRIDHTYTIEDAKNKLTYFYETVPERYPRVKGILYGDVDMYQVSPKGTEDYRLTSQDKLTEHIGGLQKNPAFLSQVKAREEMMCLQPMLYSVPAYRIEENIYVTEEQLSVVALHKDLIKYMPCIMDDSGEKFYDLTAIVTAQGGWLKQENLQK
ncbi:MAG: hypothetical protein ACRCWY_07670 [Cellulosilyticaceae bacterium]